MFKKGDLVEWYVEEDLEFPTSVGIIVGFNDSDTGEELPEEYDEANAVIEARLLCGGKTIYKYVHELQLLSAVGAV
jgi:hypothetical protein